MAGRKPVTEHASPGKFRNVGDVVEVKDYGTVTCPDGSEYVVSGGAFVLDQPGVFVIDGTEVEVK